MGILSSVNVIYARAAFLLFLAFVSVKDIRIILENPSVLLLTQAMDLPGLIMSPYSAQLGLLSLLFVMMAINDIIPLLEKNKKFFESIVPLRLMVFFVVTMLSYFWTENLYLHNNAVFIYSMSEIWINFLIFNAIRDEKNESFKNQNRFNAEEPVEELDEIDEVDIVMTSSQEIEEATYEEE